MEEIKTYTPRDLAKKLKINYRTILREIQRGNLPATKIGRIYLISEDAINLYLSTTVKARFWKVSASIVNHNGKILLVKRRAREGRLQWQFPAGTIYYAEKSSYRAEVECLMETQVHSKAVKLIGKRIHPDTNVIIYYWLCDYLSGEAVNNDPDENSEVRWATPKDVLRLFTSDVYTPVRKYLESASGLSDAEGKRGVKE